MVNCKACNQELRGKRIWDDYDLVICHLEYYCQNKLCSRVGEVLGRTVKEVEATYLKEELDEIKDRITVVEDKTADLSEVRR